MNFQIVNTTPSLLPPTPKGCRVRDRASSFGAENYIRNICSCIQFLSSLFQIHSGFPPFLLALPRPGRGVIEVLVVFLSESCIRITSAEVDVGEGL